MTSTKLTSANKRITAIDAFRGITMILMIFANHSGSHFYPYFAHARTIPGYTVVDLIEPMFYFAIALSFMLSFKSKESKYGTKEAVWSTISRFEFPHFFLKGWLEASHGKVFHSQGVVIGIMWKTLQQKIILQENDEKHII